MKLREGLQLYIKTILKIRNEEAFFFTHLQMQVRYTLATSQYNLMLFNDDNSEQCH